MRRLSIDLETYSSEPITNSVYRYVEAPDFEILLFGYAYDDEPVKVVDLASGEKLPEKVITDLFDPDIRKTAYNANFEMTCLGKFFGKPMPVEQWCCTSVLALSLGYPGYLDGVSKALGFPEDKQKMSIGKRLIQFFCLPCKPTKANGERTRNLPQHDPERWQTFKDYNAQDVVVEREILKKLSKWAPSESENELWFIDQEMQRRGVGIDTTLAKEAVDCDTVLKAKYLAELKQLTGLPNPASVSQFKTWLEYQLNTTLESVDKVALAELLTKEDTPANVKRGIELKLLVSKTSVKKYETMLNCVTKDNRIHGMLQFYGSRTGRWAGRLVQVHNLPQNHLKYLDDARSLLRAGQFNDLEMLYDSVPDVLSQLIRTAFIAKPGSRFIVADFSAIEARVIAWLAGETWRQEVFAKGGDIYCASATQMFHVPVVKHGINGELRQKGKIAELALGYQGGPGALKTMGALKMGLTESELPGIVDKWRKASPHIVQFWYDVDKAAQETVMYKSQRAVGSIGFTYDDGFMFVQLPSHRKIAYVNPKLGRNRFGAQSLVFMGMNQTTRKWEETETYGGKLVENIVQATARDCLATAIYRLDQAGYKLCFHVHDEVILEMPEGEGSLEEAISIMTQATKWNLGLKLNADGYETKYYKKD